MDGEKDEARHQVRTRRNATASIVLMWGAMAVLLLELFVLPTSPLRIEVRLAWVVVIVALGRVAGGMQRRTRA